MTPRANPCRRGPALFALVVFLLAASIVVAVSLAAQRSDAHVPAAEAASPAGLADRAGRPRPTGDLPPTPATTTTTRPVTRRPLTVAAGGDAIGARKVGTFIDARGGEAALAKMAPLLREADLAFVNLESPLSDKGRADPDKDVTLRGRPALASGLAAAGVDVVSLANNHALDWGEAALLDTLARLERAGVAAAGAGADLAAARAPALLETPGGTVALLAATAIQPAGFPAGADRAGVNPGRTEPERLLADIAAAKRRADWVIVSLHWGVEYAGQPTRDQRRLAHRAIDAGADLILGHHPHVLQGLEVYRGRLIAYSLGDFLFDHYSRETGEAVVLRVGMQPVGPPRVELVPVYLSDTHGIPAPVTGHEARRILERMRRSSSTLGVELEIRGGRAYAGPES